MAAPESVTLVRGHECTSVPRQAPDAKIQWHYLIVTLLYCIFRSHLSNGLSLLVADLLYNIIPCYGK